MGEVRLGIIGYGAQGSSYTNFIIENKVKGMTIGAICDIDDNRLDIAKSKINGVKVYNDYIEMMKSGDVDAVVTTVPHYLHPEMGIEALKLKMPVLVEKPAGVYTKQVRKLLESAERNKDVPFAIMFNQRTNPLYIKVKEILDSKELGEIRRTNWIINTWWRSSNYYNQGSWRATWGAEGGGVLVNQSPHQLDLIQWLCGTPTKVYANCEFGLHRDILVENDVTALLKYENGATGVFITCTHDVIGTDRLEINCDKGKIIVDKSEKITLYKLEKSESEIDASLDKSKVFAEEGVDNKYECTVIDFDSKWGEQHCLVLENFASHILHGTPILAKGEEGINGVKLANSMLLSTWLGKEVDYDFDEDLYIAELNKQIASEGKYPLINE